MTIEIVYFDGCPNWQLAEERLLAALGETGRTDAAVHLHLVHDPLEAEQAGMHGSPTILVDGRDPFPTASGAVWSCRLYQTQAGLEGAPGVAELTAVVR
jgi:hypothetical protein